MWGRSIGISWSSRSWRDRLPKEPKRLASMFLIAPPEYTISVSWALQLVSLDEVCLLSSKSLLSASEAVEVHSEVHMSDIVSFSSRAVEVVLFPGCLAAYSWPPTLPCRIASHVGPSIIALPIEPKSRDEDATFFEWLSKFKEARDAIPRASINSFPDMFAATWTCEKMPRVSQFDPMLSSSDNTNVAVGLFKGLASHILSISWVSRGLHVIEIGSRWFLRTTRSMISLFEAGFPPIQGIRHSKSSQKTMPRLYTSTLSPEYPSGAVSPSTGGSSISGAIQSMVPTGRHSPEKPSKRSNPPHFGFAGRRGNLPTGAALPKSQSFAHILFRSGHHVRRTLLLLTSRCAKPAPCK